MDVEPKAVEHLGEGGGELTNGDEFLALIDLEVVQDAGGSLPNAGYLGAAMAAVGLFATGASLSLFTGRSALGGGARMLAIGAGAGALTWLIGGLFGAAVG